MVGWSLRNQRELSWYCEINEALLFGLIILGPTGKCLYLQDCQPKTALLVQLQVARPPTDISVTIWCTTFFSFWNTMLIWWKLSAFYFLPWRQIMGNWLDNTFERWYTSDGYFVYFTFSYSDIGPPLLKLPCRGTNRSPFIGFSSMCRHMVPQ